MFSVYQVSALLQGETLWELVGELDEAEARRANDPYERLARLTRETYPALAAEMAEARQAMVEAFLSPRDQAGDIPADVAADVEAMWKEWEEAI